MLQRFNVLGLQSSTEVQTQPRSGQLVLYDRAVVKHFRRDAHEWKKKKDGKTVREDHEKLKIESVERLTCCYAHSEQSPSFHRRIYWLIPPKTAPASSEGGKEGSVEMPEAAPVVVADAAGGADWTSEGRAVAGGAGGPAWSGGPAGGATSAAADNTNLVLVHYLDEGDIVVSPADALSSKGSRNRLQRRARNSAKVAIENNPVAMSACVCVYYICMYVCIHTHTHTHTHTHMYTYVGHQKQPRGDAERQGPRGVGPWAVGNGAAWPRATSAAGAARGGGKPAAAGAASRPVARLAAAAGHDVYDTNTPIMCTCRI